MPAKLFAPRDLEVLLGTTVTWRNADSTTHTVTEDEDEFDSGFVRPGGTFAQTFTEQGVFVYGCSIHRFMRGSVRVFRVVLSGPDEPVPAGRRALLEGACARRHHRGRARAGLARAADRRGASRAWSRRRVQLHRQGARAAGVSGSGRVGVEPGRASAGDATRRDRAARRSDRRRRSPEPRRAAGSRSRSTTARSSTSSRSLVDGWGRRLGLRSLTSPRAARTSVPLFAAARAGATASAVRCSSARADLAFQRVRTDSPRTSGASEPCGGRARRRPARARRGTRCGARSPRLGLGALGVRARPRPHPPDVLPPRHAPAAGGRRDRHPPAPARREPRRVPARPGGGLSAAAREAAGRFLGAPASEVALTDSTTMGLGLLYTRLALRPEDEVLTTEHDFYATHESLRLSGVRVRRIALYDDARRASEDEIVSRVRRAVTGRTRVVALTWVHSSTGVRLPVRAIAQALPERVLLCIDGVHGFGARAETVGDLGCDAFVSGCTSGSTGLVERAYCGRTSASASSCVRRSRRSTAAATARGSRAGRRKERPTVRLSRRAGSTPSSIGGRCLRRSRSTSRSVGSASRRGSAVWRRA